VRFREQSLVHQLVRHALGDALGRDVTPELQLRHADILPGRPMTPAIPGVLAGGVYTSGAMGAIAAFGATRAAQFPGVEHPPSAPTAPVHRNEPSAPVAPEIRPLIPLGQFRDTFIIAIDDEGICIIDQHVAHERVLFERVMQRLTTGTLESQRLLVPMTMELPPGERAALVARAAELQRFGFELEEFGGDTLKVTAVPALLPRDECDAAIRALAQDLEGLDRGLRIEEGLKRIAATTACHAAVKANYPLTHEKMRHILEELRATAYSTVCPHGRPVMLRITRREVEKNFERI
jgi:DNA mismatch repair protein MutL